MQKFTIKLHPIGKTVTVNSGTPLIDVLHEYGVEFPCGGKGTCGNCRIRLMEGHLNISEYQAQKLARLNLGENWRLACYCNVESNITLEVSQFENIILADNTIFNFQPQKGFGVAVDLGTTTLVAQLVNLENGHIVDSVSGLNPQTRFGSDLISRIQSCIDGNELLLQNLIRDKIGQMIGSMVKYQNVEISKITIVGNTVMHHIFSGLPVNSLSYYPFHSPELGKQTFIAAQLGWDVNGAVVEFNPSIGSFIGSDILAGIAATKMTETSEYSVLIDLGTNGEIVVGNRDKVLCASTAAGPAFEGAKIRQGMRASTGAISSVTLINGKIKSHVIGNIPARGICGSGLIDVIAILLNEAQIGMFGEINSGEEKIHISGKVSLTQQDIREFQLAKAAIATGIQILMNKLGITYAEISKVYIAGGFGNFLNIVNVIRTGLIECEEDKIVKLGNTALIGAKMFLFEDDNYISAILEKTTHINLEADPDFQNIYIEKMILV